MQRSRNQNLSAGALLLASALLLPLPAGAQQTTFPTPEAGVDELVRALQANDEAAINRLFGERYRNLVLTGDPAYDTSLRETATRALATRKRLEEVGPDRRILRMGAQDWPFAIPLVREGGTWRFASEQGVEELLNRRIGYNERNAIYVLRSIVDAQKQYAEADRDGDGVLQYAAKLASTPGKHDGLYWPADTAKGEEPSPLGPLVAASSSRLEGHTAGEPYAGYRFRMLTQQGAGAPGGAYSYMINGRMLAGFAAIATPAEYGKTGVMTFIVNHNGKVYQRNLGAKPPVINSFNPVAGWTEVEDPR